jgi:hypothetical protein
VRRQVAQARPRDDLRAADPARSASTTRLGLGRIFRERPWRRASKIPGPRLHQICALKKIHLGRARDWRTLSEFQLHESTDLGCFVKPHQAGDNQWEFESRVARHFGMRRRRRMPPILLCGPSNGELR